MGDPVGQRATFCGCGRKGCPAGEELADGRIALSDPDQLEGRPLVFERDEAGKLRDWLVARLGVGRLFPIEGFSGPGEQVTVDEAAERLSR